MAKPTVHNWNTLKKPVRLSSRDLWVYRYILPLFLGMFPLAMFGAGIVHREVLPMLLGILFSAGIPFLAIRIWGWKNVYAYETFLEIRSRSRSVQIPYSQIQDVEESRWDSHLRVTTIRFTKGSDFGDSIRYLPYFKWFFRYSHNVWWELESHPANILIEHLRAVAIDKENEPMTVSH